METDGGHQFKLETPDKRLIDVSFQRDETIGMLKERLPDLLREHGCASIPRERQRLLFNSQILQPDSATLYWIAGVGADCRIHLVDNDPTENNYRQLTPVSSQATTATTTLAAAATATPSTNTENNMSHTVRKDGINLREMQQDGDERHRTLSLTRERFNTCRTLQRNFEACCEAAKCSQEPADRMRHNEPHGVSPWEPDCRDLGYITRDMAKSIECFSMELARLSDELIRDASYPDRSAQDYHKCRRLIQNLTDGARYLSPQLHNFSSFVIPLQNPPRRVLSIVTTDNVQANRLKK